MLKVVSGSRIKPFAWKHCLIYSNSWEVLSVVPVSNESGQTNSWQGIFLPHSSPYNYILTNWCTCMEQFAMNHTVNKLQTTVMQLNPRRCILCLLTIREDWTNLCPLLPPRGQKQNVTLVYTILDRNTSVFHLLLHLHMNQLMQKVVVTVFYNTCNLSDLTCFTQPQCQWSSQTTFSKVYNNTNS